MIPDLQAHLQELAAARPVVISGDAAWMSGVVSLQLSGHQLALGGVAPLVAWDILAQTFSATSPVLTAAGRYGKLWWVEIQGESRQVVLARHLRLHHDRGRPEESEVEHPILSGAR
jgi:hypothetical protein